MVLTRTIFESTPATVTPATVTGARQPANVITRRSTLARAAQQAQQSAANPQRPALGGAGGTVQRLGGDPLLPRALQSDGAVPVGGPVQRNQKIAQGGAAGQMPMPFVPVVAVLEERTLGIPGPVAGNHYGIMAKVLSRYLLVSVDVLNRTPTGGAATAGTATVLVNGEAVIFGTTVVSQGDFVSVRIDTVGTGGVLYASVAARAV